MTDANINLKLTVLGATNSAESILLLLNQCSAALASNDRDKFGLRIADVLSTISALQRQADQLADENERLRLIEWEGRYKLKYGGQ